MEKLSQGEYTREIEQEEKKMVHSTPLPHAEPISRPAKVTSDISHLG